MSLISDFLKFVGVKRDLPINTVIDRLVDYMWENYDLVQEQFDVKVSFPWPIDVMVDEQNNSYMVYTDNGRLYRADYEVSGNDVIINNIKEVMVDYPEVQSRTIVRTFRKNDKLHFVAVGSAAVLNRVGEIDSTKLFDNFVEEFNKREKPYLTYRHWDADPFAFGQINWIERVDEFLVGYGEIDETHPLGSVAEQRLSDGTWGISIGFMSNEVPEVERVGGVEIPVYNSGYLVEWSVLPEEECASYFTNIRNVKRENSMALTIEQMREKISEFTEDEELTESLVSQINENQRKIRSQGMITRDADEEVGETEAAEKSEEDVVVEVDEDLQSFIEETAERAFEKYASQFEEIKISIQDLLTATEQLQTQNAEMRERLVVVEQTEEEIVNQAFEDMPLAKRQKRFKINRLTSDAQPEEENLRTVTTADIAKMSPLYKDND